MAERREYEIAVVCTGNRFRSPIAAALLARSTGGLPVRIHSLGTLDLGPVPVLPEALPLGADLGIELESHRARAVRHASLDEADLVLGFERIHVATAVVDARARRDRAFLLPELVTLLGRIDPPAETDPVRRARAAVERAAALRSRTQLLLREVDDPLGRGPDAFAAAAAEIDGLCRRLVEQLFGRSADPG